MLILYQLLHILYTLCCFMHFLGLTYQQDAIVPVPCFLLFLVSENHLRKYSRNWMIFMPKSLFFPTRSRSPKRKRRRAPRRRHQVGARLPPATAAPHDVASGLHRLRPFAYKYPPTIQDLRPEHFSTKPYGAAAVVNPSSGGFRSSSRHPAGEGNHHRRALHHHARLRTDA